MFCYCEENARLRRGCCPNLFIMRIFGVGRQQTRCKHKARPYSSSTLVVPLATNVLTMFEGASHRHASEANRRTITKQGLSHPRSPLTRSLLSQSAEDSEAHCALNLRGPGQTPQAVLAHQGLSRCSRNKTRRVPLSWVLLPVRAIVGLYLCLRPCFVG